MLRVFVDASVLFAALYSRKGYAHDLIILGARHRLTLLITAEILDEVERNILRKAPYLHAVFPDTRARFTSEIVASPSDKDKIEVATYVVQKDVHVIAAAIAAQPDYLVTYDRKHLLDVPEVTARSGLKIVTPDIVVKILDDSR